MRELRPLTTNEREVMRTCWSLGAATTEAIHHEACRSREWDRRNLLETLRRLVGKDYLRVDLVRDGRRGRPMNLYTPLVDRNEAIHAEAERIVREEFGEAPCDLGILAEVVRRRRLEFGAGVAAAPAG